MFNAANTHELREGDIVACYGCKFRIRDRKVHMGKEDLRWDERGTVTFRTDLLDYAEGSMPRHWADTWIIQGNSRAVWSREAG